MSQADKDAFWSALKSANYGWMLASISIGIIAHFIRALRWKLIIQTFGYKPKTPNLFFAVMNMYFANAFIPRLGEVTRCAILKKYEQIPVDKSLGTVVAERAVDLLSFLMLLGGLAIFEFETFNQIYEAVSAEFSKSPKEDPSFFAKNWKYIALGVFIMAFGLLYLFRKNKFVGKLYNKIVSTIKGFWVGLKSTFLVKQKGLFALYTLLIWVLYYAMTYVCFFTLPETSTNNLLAPLTVLLFGTFAIMLFPNGIGAFPVVVSIILMLPKFGEIHSGVGTALGWIIWGAQTLLILSVGSIVMVVMPIYNRKPANKAIVNED